MKKLLSFIFLLFIPFMVKAADVEIKNITLLEKVGDVVINNEPTYKGMKINFDLSFTNVEDSVKYKVVVKNNTNETLEIDGDPQYGDHNYIKYTAEFNGDDNAIKAGEEKEIVLIVTYDKEIPVEEFDNGVYNEKGTVSISFLNLSSTNQENPLTSSLPIIAIIITIVTIITIILARHGMKKTAISLIVLTILSVPIISIAVRKISFDVESKIYIKDRCYRLDTTYGSFEEGKEVQEICVEFTENKYFVDEFYSLQWYPRKNPTDQLVLSVYREHFNNNSYVKAYNKDTNELLKEIKLSDFPKPLLQISNVRDFKYYRLEISLGTELDKEDIRLEISPDLEDYADYDIHLMYSGKPNHVTTKGPWIADRTIIAKIDYLKTFNTSQNTLTGFVRDVKDTHLYHAVWKAVTPDS